MQPFQFSFFHAQTKSTSRLVRATVLPPSTRMPIFTAKDSRQFTIGPVQLLVLQATKFCNINCSYCYLPDRSRRRRMSLDTVDAVFSDLHSSSLLGPDLAVIWHAGEPLSVPVSFYESAFSASRKLESRGCVVTHEIQTNGTLVDPRWCRFFREADFRIGLSLDGPESLHDAHRKRRSGAGTFREVMRAIGHFRKYDLDFHVICVLSRESLSFPEEMFLFFRELGVKRLGFNIDEEEGVNKESSMRKPGSSEALEAFLGRFYDLSRDTDLEVREFESLRRLIGNPESDNKNIQIAPGAIVSVDTDGNFSTFSPELLTSRHANYGQFWFGNVNTDMLASMVEKENFRRVHDEIQAGVEKCCSSCAYYSLCGGGSPANKVFENGTFDSTETLYCRLSRKTVIDVVLGNIEKELGVTGCTSGGRA